MNEVVREALRAELQPWMHVLVLGVTPEWLAGIAVRLATAALHVPLPTGEVDAILLGSEHLDSLKARCLARLGPRGKLFILRPTVTSTPEGWIAGSLVAGELDVWQRAAAPVTPDLRVQRARLESFLSKHDECTPSARSLEALLLHALNERTTTTCCLAEILGAAPPRAMQHADPPLRSHEELVVMTRHVRRQTLELVDQFSARMDELDAEAVARVLGVLELQQAADLALIRT